MSKRFFRAKEKLRSERIKIELPELDEIDKRLTPVLRTIYLLFNEGFYSSHGKLPLRKDLSLEAIRLCSLLIENNRTDTPEVNAKLSLMCFHISRFDARQNLDGDPILYDDQNRNDWNVKWISKGEFFLHQATKGNVVSKYHLEAGIAFWHTRKEDTETKWKTIINLYDHLLKFESTPLILLNRMYALSKAIGKEEAIQEAEKLNFTGNRYYYILLGELYAEKFAEKSRVNFHNALNLSKNSKEKSMIKRRMEELKNVDEKNQIIDL